MNGKPFFDTNILIYAYRADDHRASVAESLLAAGGVIGVQQLNEFASVARRKLGRSWEEVISALEDIQLLCPHVHPLTADTHQAAVAIARRHGYGIYDALVIATAIEASCPVLYSEDMQDGQKIGTLTIRNPF